MPEEAVPSFCYPQPTVIVIHVTGEPYAQLSTAPQLVPSGGLKPLHMGSYKLFSVAITHALIIRLTLGCDMIFGLDTCMCS